MLNNIWDKNYDLQKKMDKEERCCGTIPSFWRP
jgi:hypothetical protein